jgi:hypothetical protein
VEEVATLATRFGWSYEALMAMSGTERRLWLTAADKVAPATAAPRPEFASETPPAPSPEASPAPRLTTEAERRARLLELSEQFAARYRR